MQSFVAISRLSHRTAQRRRISGETKARRQTFAPQGRYRKSLKAGNLSDMRRSADLFADRRPRRHPAQVETYRASISKEMSFLLVIQSTKWFFIFSLPGRMRSYRSFIYLFFFLNLITDAWSPSPHFRQT
ncbi:hypothetical protein CHARACLAT_017014 [Characodon lateralis]|uniref:Uncharacterized protein n=1 Tax=Characodon lateralis TaxID=208331 RepID=A0ABU7EL14_9TELE|nr:hypothetical protein [Characodon lateralis]